MNMSEREREIIEANEKLLKPLAQGKGFKEIAGVHGVKPTTLIKRAERIRKSLGCSNLVQLIHVCTSYWHGKNVTSDGNGMVGG